MPSKEINFNELCDNYAAEVVALPKTLSVSDPAEIANVALMCGILVGRMEVLDLVWEAHTPIPLKSLGNPHFAGFASALTSYLESVLKPAVDELLKAKGA